MKKNKLFLTVLFFAIFFSSGLGILRSQEFFFDPTAKISMDFKDANIKDVLKVFSVQSGANFIASSALGDKTLTLYLNNVSIEDALNQIIKANNLSYEFMADSNIYIVKDMGVSTIETITRVYKLKYARVENSWINDEVDVKLTPQQDQSSTGSTSTNSSSSSSTTEKEEYGLTKVIKRILTEHGKIVEDRRTNSLIVTDIPMNFSRIESVVQQLDVPLPQVLIQVEMLDVSKQTADALGINWSGIWMNVTGAGGRPTEFPFTADALKRFLPVPPAATWGTLSATALTGALNFIESKTDTKYLARPRIMCMNNELAEIKITTDQAIGITNNQVGGQGGLTTSAAEAERAETGVKLRVAPQINIETGEITMYVEPVVKDISGQTTFTIGGATNTYSDPEERSTKSTLRIKDGETIVIGGLLRDRKQVQIQEIPVFSKIPFLGKMLFTYKRTGQTVGSVTGGPGRTDQRELIVFITPHIIKDDAVMQFASAKTESTLPRQEMPITVPVREQAPLTQRQKTISETLKNFE